MAAVRINHNNDLKALLSLLMYLERHDQVSAR